ncbi:MAG: glycoside hydrolase family 95-like protein [bacterium]
MNESQEFGRMDCGAEARRRLDCHIIEYTQPAGLNVNRHQGGAGDGPLLGNGDLGAIIIGTPDRLLLQLGKNDFWDTRRGDPWISPESIGDPALVRGPTKGMWPDMGHRIRPDWLREDEQNEVHLNCSGPPCPKPLGRIELRIPALAGARFMQRQNLFEAVVESSFDAGDHSVLIRHWLSATENTVITEIHNTGKAALEIEVALHRHRDILDKSIPDAVPSAAGGALCVEQRLPPSTALPEGIIAAFAASVVGAAARTGTSDLTATASFVAAPGQTIVVVAHALSSFDAPAPADAAVRRIRAITMNDVAALREAHAAWWREYWSASFVEIDDAFLERLYYANQYILGCACRHGKQAPGLYGPWIVCDYPAWNGDYHLDYNFQQVFYAIYSSNRLDLAWPYYEHIASLVPLARHLARRDGFEGIRFPGVTYAFDPDYTYCDGSDIGQKSLTAWVVQGFLWHWLHTRDEAFLRRFYPMLKECGDYYLSYVRKDAAGRYCVPDSLPQEGRSFDATGKPLTTNVIIDLALIRFLMRGLIDASLALGADELPRARWRDLLDNLAPYPTMEYQPAEGGEPVTVFADVEGGTAWQKVYAVSLYPIFSGDDVGLGSDSRTLEIARATSRHVPARPDNRFILLPTAAARVGRSDALDLLKRDLGQRLYSNMAVDCFPVGQGDSGAHGYGIWVENCAIPLVVNEVLLQSHQGVIRVFPSLPEGASARFGNLRAVGAFLVSSESRSGSVSHIDVVSEAGRECRVAIPWSGFRISAAAGGTNSPVSVKAAMADGIATFSTRRGIRYRIEPA